MKRPNQLFTRGLVTGLFGAAAVAAWFFVLAGIATTKTDSSTQTAQVGG